MESTGRPLVPGRPWPTAFKEGGAVVRLVAIVATMQFLLGGLDHVLTGALIVASWWAAGAFVLVATIRIEKYLARRRRLEAT